MKHNEIVEELKNYLSYSWLFLVKYSLCDCKHCGWMKSTCWRTVLMRFGLLLCHFFLISVLSSIFLCYALRTKFSSTITCINIEMLNNKSRAIQSALKECCFTFLYKFVVYFNMGIPWYLVLSVWGLEYSSKKM